MVSSLFEWISFDILGDDRGSLTAIEAGQLIPFGIERVYYIYNTKAGVERGFHAHRDLQQVLITVTGSCKIRLDDGSKKETIVLNCPNKGILLGSMVWREMYDFSPDCVLLCLASAHYDESDYIRDYKEFKKLSMGFN